MLETSNLLQSPVSKYIVFRFLKIESTSENTQEFSWLSFKEASSYIIELSNSEGRVFQEKVAATNNLKETYYYEKAILQPGDDYLFTVEIDPDPQFSFLDSYTVNNEESIAESLAQGRNQIKQLDLSEQAKVNLLEQLDSLLIAKNEILNIIESIASQVNNSEIVGFLNSLLAQDSAFTLLKKANSTDDILSTLTEIANQLAAAYITLNDFVYLSKIETPLAENLGEQSLRIAYFSKNLQDAEPLNFKIMTTSTITNCFDCRKKAGSDTRKWIMLCKNSICKQCDECRNLSR